MLDAGFFSVEHVQYDASHSFECTALQWLCKEVCEHACCRAEGYFDLTFFYLVCYKEVAYINMAGSL